MTTSGRHRTTLITSVTAVVIGVALTLPLTAAAAPEGKTNLPPFSRDALARRFDPALARLGVHTTRAILQNLRSYRPDPKGTHLAIYVEPTGPYDDATYIANVTKIARVFVPSVFRRWRDLESFDVCQEPLPLFGRTSEPPPPKTQVLVTRQGVRRVRDWAHATLTQFLAASARANAKPNPDGPRQTLFVYVATELRSEPAYQRAADAAGVTTATTSAVR